MTSPTCPNCNHPIQERQIRSWIGQINRAKAGKPDKQTAHDRAKKAAAARWAKRKVKR